MRWILDRILSREIARTNGYGADHRFKVGAVVDGYRVTRHGYVAGSPWGTVHVYGRPES